MNSFTEKRVTWKRVMMRSWTGLTLPRTAPKATQTEPTQKSALMRLWGDRSGEGLRPQQEVALQALGLNLDFRHLWVWACGLNFLSLSFIICGNGHIAS